MDKVELLLKEFTEAYGVSGHEDDIRRLMARELGPLSDDIKYDKMGSIMVVKGFGQIHLFVTHNLKPAVRNNRITNPDTEPFLDIELFLNTDIKEHISNIDYFLTFFYR